MTTIFTVLTSNPLAPHTDLSTSCRHSGKPSRYTAWFCANSCQIRPLAQRFPRSLVARHVNPSTMEIVIKRSAAKQHEKTPINVAALHAQIEIFSRPKPDRPSPAPSPCGRGTKQPTFSGLKPRISASPRIA